MALGAHFLRAEDVDDRRHRALHGVGIGVRCGGSRVARWYDGQRYRARRQPFGTEGRHDEERGNGDGRGLREDEPEAQHRGGAKYTKISLKTKCLRAKSWTRPERIATIADFCAQP